MMPAAWVRFGRVLLAAMATLGVVLAPSVAQAMEIALPAARLGAASAVVGLYAAFCGAIILVHRRRRLRASAAAAAMASGDGEVLLVAFASQTGLAEQLAWQTAQAVKEAGSGVRILPLDEVDEAQLAAALRVLLVVSTTGEGDAPDNAIGFARAMMGAPQSLGHLGYGMLALGDRSYDGFCAFGHRMEGWLRSAGAQPLFDTIEVDNGDGDALRRWQHHIGVLSGNDDMPDWVSPRYENWTLKARQRLNAGSPGDPAYHIVLTPPDAGATWQAGDIAEISPRNSDEDVTAYFSALGLDDREVTLADGTRQPLRDVLASSVLPCGGDPAAVQGLTADDLAVGLKPLPHREYSIASVPADGDVELVVRQMAHPDGRLGHGSGWLTAHAPVGATVALRVRANRSFHGPADDRPMILVGNGTGIAGLRSHLRERILAGRAANWLIFGERTQAHDFHFRAELERQAAHGHLRISTAFSRDQAVRIYVQDVLRSEAAELREWVARGAAIYVCGSLQGMAAGVDAALDDILGPDQLEYLRTTGRYRRDVY